MKITKKGSAKVSSSEKVEGKRNYGGAYDVDPYQYFTKDDIIEFGDGVAFKLSNIYDMQFRMVDVYIVDYSRIVVELANDNDTLEVTGQADIDMRKVRKPADIHKFADAVIKDIQDDHEIEDFIESVESCSNVTASDDPEYEGPDWPDPNDSGPYEFVATKSVQDSDGFYTDYTMYYDPETDTYFMMFGDIDLTEPDPGYADWECETLDQAWEWFNSYNGFADEEDDIELSTDIDPSIKCSKSTKNPWQVSVIDSTPYVLGKDYYYDTVENLLDAGWGDVLDIVKDLGYVSNGNVIVPKGTKVYISDEGVNHYYNSMRFEDGSWIPVLVEDVITEIEPNAQRQVEGSVHYPNGEPVSDIDLDKYLDYNFGTDRDKDNNNYTEEEKQRSVDYWFKKHDRSLHASEDFEEYEDDIKEIDQEFTSENTSINSTKLPAVFKMVSFAPGTINIDYGGGRFDNVADYLTQYDVINLVYDPYNRTPEHNKEVIKTIRKAGGADTATCSNVLNVIKEPEVRKNVLENIKKVVKSGGAVYITVYEGNGSGEGSPTKSGYQTNRKTADYLDEIKEVFPNATRKGKLIVAKNNGSVESAQKVEADYLDPPEYPEPDEVDPWDETIELDVDAYITVDNVGSWVYCDSEGNENEPDGYSFCRSDEKNGDWHSEEYSNILIGDSTDICEDFDSLIEANIPAEPGFYHITCKADLVYEISGVERVITDQWFDEDHGYDYDEEIYTDNAETDFSLEKSKVRDFNFDKIG